MNEGFRGKCWFVLIVALLVTQCSKPVDSQTLQQQLVGRWIFNNSGDPTEYRNDFGPMLFDFREDGTLIMQDLKRPAVHVLAYRFIGPQTIELIGDANDKYNNCTMYISIDGVTLGYAARFHRRGFSYEFLMFRSVLTRVPDTYVPSSDPDVVRAILGRWIYIRSNAIFPENIKYDRFGESVFEFMSDGTLIVYDIVHEQTHQLQYFFTDDHTLEISGDDHFAAELKVNISNDMLVYRAKYRDRLLNLDWAHWLRRVPDLYNPRLTAVAKSLSSNPDSHPGKVPLYDFNAIWASRVSGSSTTTASGTVIEIEPFAVVVGDGGVILRYRGDTLTQMDSRTQKDLYGVGGNNVKDLFAVGARGTILHYDGQVWTEMSSDTSNDLRAVAGDGEGGAYAVGEGPVLLHYDGISWQNVDIENLAPERFDLASLLVFGPSDVFAGGTRGILLHYDGQDWTNWTKPQEVPGTDLRASILLPYERITSIWGSSAYDLFITTSADQPSLLYFDGQSWQRLDNWPALGLSISSSLQVGGSTEGLFGTELFLVGEQGLILQVTHDAIQQIGAGTTGGLHAISASGNDVFMVGEQNTFIHYNGIIWRKIILMP